MELQEFINNFANQFDDTDISEFQSDTVFQDLEEWTSMTVLAIIALIKTTYNKTITGKEIRSCETIKDLFNLVTSK